MISIKNNRISLKGLIYTLLIFLSTFICTILLSPKHNKDTASIINKEESIRSNKLKPVENLDYLIKKILACVDADSIRSNMQILQNFGERFSPGKNQNKVAEWINHRFINCGIHNTRIDSFCYYNNFWIKNVIATIKGKRLPADVVVIGAHYDSFTPEGNLAPGADDNASGISAVLEILRALKITHFEPDVTLMFVAFGAEEHEGLGSENFVKNIKKTGINIKLMLNLDMISYSTKSANQSVVDLNVYPGNEILFDEASELIKKYTSLKPNKRRMVDASDSRAFYRRGIPVLYFEENEENPYCHGSNDLVKNCNIEYAAEVTKAACSLLINHLY